ncbi:MAG: glycosyltransferase [Anaeroplasmataceae bacterium]|nr:glycosyltransferase [Anaeroplasmataceae bacterium]
MKKVSILLTAKNAGETIYSCIESIVKQTYPNIEIIVLDAGSKDKTMKFVRLQQNLHNEIMVYERRNTTIAALRKLGLSLATGELVLFVLAEDILNHNAVTEFVKCIEENDADIAVGSFFHPYYKGYMENAIFDLSKPKELLLYQRNLFANTMLTGKLYKKSLFEEIRIKDSFLNEERINLEILKNTKKIVTTEKILLITQEHRRIFEGERFWENQQSFWYACQENLLYREMFSKKNKKFLPKVDWQEFINIRAIDYLLWELLCYASNDATIESIAMEMNHILKDETFLTLVNEIPTEGLAWKKLDDNELLAYCILYADLSVKQISSLQDIISQVSILKVCYMIFIHLFYKQVSALNTEYFICSIREELNLNESKEAKFVNDLNL